MSIGRIKSITPRGRSGLTITWDDGHRAEIDLSAIIAAHPRLAPLIHPDEFMVVAEDLWSVVWQRCGIELGAAQLRRWADEQAREASVAFRAWMERNRLTLDGAAQALGLSRRTIAYYLSGEQPVPKTVMLATEGYDKRQAA